LQDDIAAISSWCENCLFLEAWECAARFQLHERSKQDVGLPSYASGAKLCNRKCETLRIIGRSRSRNGLILAAELSLQLTVFVLWTTFADEWNEVDAPDEVSHAVKSSAKLDCSAPRNNQEWLLAVSLNLSKDV